MIEHLTWMVRNKQHIPTIPFPRFLRIQELQIQLRMEALLSSLKDTVSLVADSKVILGGAGGLALLSISGAIPRVGFVRAFSFGWRNYFKKTYPLSVRKSEIKLLNDTIKSGEKGNGKSCFIDTALNHHHGVSKISVSLSFCSFFLLIVDWNLFFYRLNLVLVKASSLIRCFEKSPGSNPTSWLVVPVVSCSSILYCLSSHQLW